jgi:hypothetical protein
MKNVSYIFPCPLISLAYAIYYIYVSFIGLCVSLHILLSYWYLLAIALAHYFY